MNDQAAETSGTTRKGRIGALDTLRGVALIAMASYHFTWDLELFGYIEPGTATQGLWKIYARLIASSFLFLAGFSLFLAHGKTINWPSFRKRLLMVAGAAALITIATAFAFPEGLIFFGILHNIAAASLIGLIFLRLPVLFTLLVAVAAVVAPFYLTLPLFDAKWLVWLGLSVTPPRSNDFVPLLPWFAPFLFGLAMAKVAISQGWLERFRSPSSSKNPFALAGRHSLMFYLVHQPLLIGLVYLASVVMPPVPADQTRAYVQSCERSCNAQQPDAALCQRFCGCTVEQLKSQSLFEGMLTDSLTPEQSTKLNDIANQCSQAVQ